MKNKKDITYNEMIKRGYLKVTLSEEDFIILKADIKDDKYGADREIKYVMEKLMM